MAGSGKQHMLRFINQSLEECEKQFKNISESLLDTNDPEYECKLKRKHDKYYKKIIELEQTRNLLIKEIENEDKTANRNRLLQQWTSLQSILEFHNDCFEIMVLAYHQSLRKKPNILVEVPTGIEELIIQLSRHRSVEKFVVSLIRNSLNPVLNNELHLWGDQYVESWSSYSNSLDSANSLSFEEIKKLLSGGYFLEQPSSIEPESISSLSSVPSGNQSAVLIAISMSLEAASQTEYGKIYQLEAWLIQDIDTYRSNSQGYKKWERVDYNPDETHNIPGIKKLIVQSLEYFRSISPKHSYSPIVHIFLPAQFLNEAIEFWDSDLTNKLGCDYRVCMRSIDRLSPNYRYYPLWQMKWQRIQPNQTQTVEALFESIEERKLSAFQLRLQSEFNEVLISLQDAYQLDSVPKFESLNSKQLDEFYSELLDKPVHGLMGVLVNKSLTSDNSIYLLNLLLNAGIPLAIWQRRSLSPSAVPNTAQDLLSDKSIETISQCLRKSRCEAQNYPLEAHVGHHLSFLQDDPELVPPPYLKRA